ncbi:MAG: ABC transporter ATP-binding protein [Deltaproteobacteria bacterium]|jgi:putative spermidine/putrescine transport system ATP-binding protein|nr:ABC transporter ATP-binding protein [Deltaproteobacteria bacterium]
MTPNQTALVSNSQRSKGPEKGFSLGPENQAALEPGPRERPFQAEAPRALAAKESALVIKPVSISLRDLAKTFGQQRVVEPFSLDIPAGKKVALLGPSGCGKTTTLRLIAGLEAPDPGGRVLLGQQDVTQVPVEKRQIGMVFQHFALFPHMNVAENVAYGLKARKRPKAERQSVVEAMLDLVKLSDLAQRRVDRLSGGQKQRVALARALASGPRVLLLDEPLAALDAILRVSLREELEELLSRLGITTVMVTHDQDEAMALGDIIVVMKDGRVEQTGSPYEIYHCPKTSFVAGFVGGSNHLVGQLDGDYLRLPGSGCIPISALRNQNGKALAGHQDHLATVSQKAALEAALETRSKEPAKPNFDPLSDLREGQVSVYFRPDQPKLAPIVPGRVRGTVVSKRFVGQKIRLVVRLSEEISIKLELPSLSMGPGQPSKLENFDHGLDSGQALKFEAYGGSHEPGQTVGVYLPPEELLLFSKAL